MDGIFLQQMINGLTLGSVYGLIAIGYTKVLVPETMGRSLDEVGEEMKSRYERESAPVKP